MLESKPVTVTLESVRFITSSVPVALFTVIFPFVKSKLSPIL